MSTPALSGLRIVGVVALKDVLDAIRNRITLGIMLGAALLMLSGLGLPRLLAGRNANRAVVYDPGAGGLVQAWAARDDLQAVGVRSQAELEQIVAESASPTLGLVLPAGFAAPASTAEPLTVDGYTAHWARPDQVARQVTFFEARLSQAAGRTVRIVTAGHVVYPAVRAGGQVSLFAMHVVMELLIVGMAVVPYLLIEEKEARTFDALLVSPASYGQVVAGKALAGAAFCLLGGAVGLTFMAAWVVHWDVALLAIGLGAIFAVGVGLLGGALARDAQILGLGMMLLASVLLAPALLGPVATSNLPAWVQSALRYVPSMALLDLMRAAMAGDLRGAPIAFNALVLGVGAAAVYAFLIWRVRQAQA
jgi:ABC-type Na+ efflux pump permease subunit